MNPAERRVIGASHGLGGGEARDQIRRQVDLQVGARQHVVVAVFESGTPMKVPKSEYCAPGVGGLTPV